MERLEAAGSIPSALVVDWDSVELLPRERCAVCGETKVPWGIRHGRFLCSKRCGELHAWAGEPAGSAATAAHTH